MKYVIDINLTTDLFHKVNNISNTHDYNDVQYNLIYAKISEYILRNNP